MAGVEPVVSLGTTLNPSLNPHRVWQVKDTIGATKSFLEYLKENKAAFANAASSAG